jgi:HKD family nuclease
MLLIAQPDNQTVSHLASHLCASASLFRAATAYVTFSGANVIANETCICQLPKCKKEWLIGIDWYRSEPSAIDVLQSLPNSDVRITDGEFLVSTPNCRPRTTYHPKAYMVKGERPVVIVGSANLSRNGLCRSIELSLASTESSVVNQFDGWFSQRWRKATPWTDIRSRYNSQYVAAKACQFVVTEDDDIIDPDVLKFRWVTAERIRLMRTAQNLWVDVGALHNRDWQGLPGTDLQFTQLTRVFFGHPAKTVPGNAPLLDVRLSMANARTQTRPMKYNRSSSMDRLSLPVPGNEGWPDKYDYSTLMFSKWPDGSFRVTVANGRDRADWKRQSERNGFCLSMNRNEREWGVF